MKEIFDLMELFKEAGLIVNLGLLTHHPEDFAQLAKEKPEEFNQLIDFENDGDFTKLVNMLTSEIEFNLEEATELWFGGIKFGWKTLEKQLEDLKVHTEMGENFKNKPMMGDFEKQMFEKMMESNNEEIRKTKKALENEISEIGLTFRGMLQTMIDHFEDDEFEELYS